MVLLSGRLLCVFPILAWPFWLVFCAVWRVYGAIPTSSASAADSGGPSSSVAHSDSSRGLLGPMIGPFFEKPAGFLGRILLRARTALSVVCAKYSPDQPSKAHPLMWFQHSLRGCVSSSRFKHTHDLQTVSSIFGGLARHGWHGRL